MTSISYSGARKSINVCKCILLFIPADWNLEIDPVSIKDDGKYQCQVTPHRSRDAYVQVWVAPEDPFIEDGPVMQVKESVEVELECVARGGKPPAKVSSIKVLENEMVF